MLLEPLFNDPALRKTNFVMVHGGWPFTREIGALLTKPNAYLDFSEQSLLLGPASLAATPLGQILPAVERSHRASRPLAKKRKMKLVDVKMQNVELFR